MALRSAPVPASFPVHGHDISSYQPVGAWRPAGWRDFGIAKASEATTYRDRNYAGNRKAAHDIGLTAFGSYDFARPGKNSPDAEWATFASVVGPPRLGEFVVLDYEVSPWNEAWACRWADLAHAAGWPRVVFYSYLGMVSSNPTSQIAAHFDDLWVAAYGTRIPGGDRWHVSPYGWTFWQHTDGQPSVPGNDSPFDCSAFFGSKDQLAAWVAGAGPVPTPTPAPRPRRFPARVPVILAD